MSRITVVWVSKSGASSRVVSVSRSTVAFALGAAGLLLVAAASGVFWAGHLSLRAARAQFLESELEAHRALVTEKEQELDRVSRDREQMLERLERIRATENRIRSFLGLNPQVYDDGRSHQGGMGGGGEEEGGGPTGALGPGAVDRSISVRFAAFSETLQSGLEEVLARLEDRRDEARRRPVLLPVASSEVWLSCNFGHRTDPFSGLGREFHNGIDIAGPWKAPVIAPADGEVEEVGRDRLLGNYVKLRHGGGVKTLYGHLATAEVRSGRHVKRGDVIGRMGNTGRSTGTHLHYSVSDAGRYVDPQDYIWDRPFRALTL